jgi:hypothetical protein
MDWADQERYLAPEVKLIIHDYLLRSPNMLYIAQVYAGWLTHFCGRQRRHRPSR